MLSAVRELEGIDYVMFPYNFIHARADYGQFLPEAARRGVGLIAIKPLAAGSIVKLDPRALGGRRSRSGILCSCTRPSTGRCCRRWWRI
jgi:aryl-alcohol dehydrogenase-like predicted oxidoreductase